MLRPIRLVWVVVLCMTLSSAQLLIGDVKTAPLKDAWSKIATGDGAKTFFGPFSLMITDSCLKSPISPTTKVIHFSSVAVDGTALSVSDRNGTGILTGPGIMVPGRIVYSTGFAYFTFSQPPQKDSPIQITYDCGTVIAAPTAPTPVPTSPTPTTTEPSSTTPPITATSTPTATTTPPVTTSDPTVTTSTPTVTPSPSTTTASTPTVTNTTATPSTGPGPIAVLRPTTSTMNIANLLEPVRTQYNVPGMAAIVVHNGKIVGIGATGNRANSNSITYWDTTKGWVTVAVNDQPLTAEDKFHLGSNSKSITATMIAKLVQDGRFVNGWNTQVSEVFTNIPISSGFRDATLRQLLAHRTGLPWAPSPDFWDVQFRLHNSYNPLTLTELQTLRQTITAQELAKNPASTPGGFVYSNLGIVIAAHMAEVVMNQPWETLVQTYLFTPLGMTSAGFGPPGTKCTASPCTPDQPWGHDANGKTWLPGDPSSDNAPMSGPAGNIHMSLSDWATYANMHLKALEGNPTYLTQSTLESLHIPVAYGDGLNYAGGWWAVNSPYDANARRSILSFVAGVGDGLTHDGSNLKWYATTSIDATKDLAILVVTTSGGDLANRAAWAAIAKLYDYPWPE